MVQILGTVNFTYCWQLAYWHVGWFCAVGVVFGPCAFCTMATGFDVNQFAANPSRTSFESCRKADLISVAKHYDIEIRPGALKREIKPVVLQGLVDKGVLGSSPVAGLVGAALPETLEKGGVATDRAKGGP